MMTRLEVQYMKNSGGTVHWVHLWSETDKIGITVPYSWFKFEDAVGPDDHVYLELTVAPREKKGAA